MEKIKEFFKKYWYIWLIAFTISLVVMLIGTSVVGNFIYKLFNGIFQFILIIAIIGLIYTYTFGKDSLKIWGVFRLIGFLGIILFGIGLYSICENASNIFQVSKNPNSGLIIGLFLASIFFVFLGEILLYFAKYNYKLNDVTKKVSQIQLDILNLSHRENSLNQSNDENKTMICPTCYGKGFVDLIDIERLGKKKIWEQGYCVYCKGTGSVKKGKTLKKNPLDIEPQNFY